MSRSPSPRHHHTPPHKEITPGHPAVSRERSRSRGRESPRRSGNYEAEGRRGHSRSVSYERDPYKYKTKSKSRSRSRSRDREELKDERYVKRDERRLSPIRSSGRYEKSQDLPISPERYRKESPPILHHSHSRSRSRENRSADKERSNGGFDM